MLPAVMDCNWFGRIENTLKGVPAAAQMMSNCSKSRSIQVSTGLQCPTGGTPPIPKPVGSRTNSGVALSICSPINSDIRCSFTRFAPLAINEHGPARLCRSENYRFRDLGNGAPDGLGGLLRCPRRGWHLFYLRLHTHAAQVFLNLL